jgi:hypothetical protein
MTNKEAKARRIRLLMQRRPQHITPSSYGRMCRVILGIVGTGDASSEENVFKGTAKIWREEKDWQIFISLYQTTNGYWYYGYNCLRWAGDPVQIIYHPSIFNRPPSGSREMAVNAAIAEILENFRKGFRETTRKQRVLREMTAWLESQTYGHPEQLGMFERVPA